MNETMWKEKDFTQNQLEEIEEGYRKGLDIAVYARKDFLALQMRQIRLGLEAGLPVEAYANKQFDWFQMEEIRKGLRDHLDISVYAKPEIPYDIMQQLRKGLKEGLNLTPYSSLPAGILREIRKANTDGVNIDKYVKEGYDAEQIGQIRHALNQNIDLTPYLTKEFLGVSIAEIRKGLRKGLDVSVYAKVIYSWQQMREIRLGLEKQEEVSIYLSSLYSWQQMREIRLGLEKGLDVSGYKSLTYTAGEMRKRRHLLQSRHAEERTKKEGRAETAAFGEKAGAEKIEVTISQDGMEAYISLRSREVSVSVEELHAALALSGVCKGIDEKALEHISKGVEQKKKIKVAQGAGPVDGRDGYYEFFFRTELNRTPRLLENGFVDYQDIEWYEMAKQDQKLACYHKAEEGTCGYSVTGELISAKKGREKSVLYGKGVRVTPDRTTYFATLTGRVELKKNMLEVSKLLILEEMTLATGNVIFDGLVHVKGNVGSGTLIRATEDIVVDGFVEGATIESGGNVILRQGMNASGSGYVRAEKSVIGKFFEAALVYAGGDINVNYALNSKLSAEGHIIIAGVKGTLAGGSAFAAKGLFAYNLGNPAGISTFVKLGQSESMIMSRNKVEEKLKDVNRELLILRNGYESFNRKLALSQEVDMDIYLKIENAIYTKEKELEKLSEIKGKQDRQAAKSAEAKAVIKGTLFEGVLLEIGGMRWAAKYAQNITVKKVEQRIGVFANQNKVIR